MTGQARTMLDAGEIRRRLQSPERRVGARSQGGFVRGDHDLNPDLQPKEPLIPAAVLIPIIDRPGGLTVLLTERTKHLAAHAGQISFPGGRLEPSDRDANSAALRETEEEIGLTRDRVEIAGRLDTYYVRTGYVVTPVVGLVAPRFDLRLDPHEVAAAFEVPLDFLLDPANHQRRSRVDVGGVTREFWAMPYREHFIWGATAGMLVNLYEVIGR
jgi:8-oxo-dGTP pyrophosphatase MutT (NUDIX family)